VAAARSVPRPRKLFAETLIGWHGSITRRRHSESVMSARTFANYVSNFLLLVVSLILLSLAAWSSFR
jgi:hypothetical protein